MEGETVGRVFRHFNISLKFDLYRGVYEPYLRRHFLHYDECTAFVLHTRQLLYSV